ncbi:hypothetical protein DSLASN_02890 [Desulfoluna limicola]|uniref:Uncharacterized protein n=1 Tax=Desulfoluna limicola TaxID=2810562 RepID=A0ABN6F001_9BACT|nr:hypothetical protein DSLASN_02890 [Desulfoluna limicola]
MTKKKRIENEKRGARFLTQNDSPINNTMTKIEMIVEGGEINEVEIGISWTKAKLKGCRRSN